MIEVQTIPKELIYPVGVFILANLSVIVGICAFALRAAVLYGRTEFRLNIIERDLNAAHSAIRDLQKSPQKGEAK